MTAGRNQRIDEGRLWSSLQDMARIGPGVAGGNDRQALSDADAEGRALFRQWCEAAGLTVAVDRLGSMFALRPGTDPDAAPVWTGSHLDTQPTGGRYDGVLGVLAGLEVVRSMNDMGLRTRRPVVVVNWTNEEGCRFAPSLAASGVFAGRMSEDRVLASRDGKGLAFGDELERIGWRGPEPVGGRPIHALVELHIEQGPILEAEGFDIGVVTGGQGLWWLQITLTGRDSHAGSTPMGLRADAGLGMARIIDRVHGVAMAHQPDAVATVGQAEVFPNSRNVIPGRAVLTVDMRTVDGGKLASMRAAIEAAALEVAADLGLDCAFEVLAHSAPVHFDRDLAQVVRQVADALGLSHRDIISGAGHDACAINDIAPTVMIFTPCEGGVSHNESEAITPAWAAAGADVLLRTVLELAEVEQ